MDTNVLFVVTSHDIVDATVYRVDHIRPELLKLYMEAIANPDRTVYIEGYPAMNGNMTVKMPCRVDSVVYIRCTL
jgi:hypothetical protein